MEKSKIVPDIDLSADGKQFGHARLPFSVHRSAYGWLPVPMVCIKNGPGKTVLLMAGTHGDEYEGQIALCRMAQEMQPEQIRGRLIILPMANYPAAKAGKRVSPIDGGNLARIYPGNPCGTVTQMIAHFIETELMSQADLVLDLHSGGSSLNYLPSVTSLLEPGNEASTEIQTYMDLFGAPYGLQFVGRRGIGSTSDAANRNNIIRIGCEMGGSGWACREYRELCELGSKRILQHVGILVNASLPSPGRVNFLTVDKDCFVYAETDGIFEPSAKLGDTVKKGDLAGLTYFPQCPMQAPEPVYFGTSGIVVCERSDAMCETGDCLFHLAH